MRLSRAERSLLVDWWFTVDRALLAARSGHRRRRAAAVAGGEPVHRPQARAARHSISSSGMWSLRSRASSSCSLCRCCRPRGVRRLALVVLLVAFALMALVLMVGAEINGARRWLHVGGYSLQPSEFAKPAFVVLSAWLLAEGERRPDMPAMPLAVSLYLVVRLPAGAAARRRPGAAGEPRVGGAVPARRQAARMVLRACGGARCGCARRLHEPGLRALRIDRFCIPPSATASRPTGRCSPSSRAASSARARARAPSRPCCPMPTPTSSSR